MRFVVFVSGTVLALSLSSVALAYDSQTDSCGNPFHWPSDTCTTECSTTAYKMYELCNDGSAPAITSAQRTIANQSLWMWNKDGRDTAYIYQSFYPNNCYGYYDDGDDWWGAGITPETESQFHFYSYDCEDSLGTELSRTQSYPYPYCTSYHSHMLNTDIRINTSSGCNWTTDAHDTFTSCFQDGPHQQSTFVHEVGHAHALDHFNSWSAAMNTGRIHHMCNTGQSFRTQTYADDAQGLVNANGRNWTSKTNLSGMVYYRDGNGDYTSSYQPALDPYCTTTTEPLGFTRMNYYGALGNWNNRATVVLVPRSVEVPEDSDVVWWGPTYNYYQGHSGATYPVTGTVTVPASVVVSGQYRLWIRFDRYDDHSEQDEDDNWVPLAQVYGDC